MISQTPSIGHNSLAQELDTTRLSLEAERAKRIETERERDAYKAQAEFHQRRSEIVKALVGAAGVSAVTKTIGVAIVFGADKDGAMQAGTGELMRYGAVSDRRVVYRAIDQLADLKLIEAERASGSRRQSYFKLLPEADIRDAVEALRAKAATSGCASHAQPARLGVRKTHSQEAGCAPNAQPGSAKSSQPAVGVRNPHSQGARQTHSQKEKSPHTPLKEKTNNNSWMSESVVGAGPTRTAERMHAEKGRMLTKSQMAAALNPHDAQAQRQCWWTDTGRIEVAGPFREELLRQTGSPEMLEQALSEGLKYIGHEIHGLNLLKQVRAAVSRQLRYIRNDQQRFDRGAKRPQTNADGVSQEKLDEARAEYERELAAAQRASGAKF